MNQLSRHPAWGQVYDYGTMHNDFLGLIASGTDASFLDQCGVFYDYIEDEDVLDELDY